MKTLIRYGLKRVDAGLVLSPSLAKCLAPVIPSEKIYSVPNGVDDNFHSEKISHLNGQLNVLFLGNLLKSKGVYTLVQAAPQVLTDVPNARFIFAGDWFSSEERKETENFIRKHELGSQITFLGPVSGQAKEECLRDSAVLVMPTYYPFEGQPLVLLEAMSASLPIVTTRLPAILDTLPEGENAVYVDSQSPAQLAEVLKCLLKDPAKRKTMGENNRSRYLKFYTQESFARRMLDVFAKVSK